MLKMGADWDEREFEKERELIQAEMVSMVHDIADRILYESQVLVPVDKGTLKKSANVIHGGTYSYVGYNTPYARPVHDGYDAHTQKVRAHERIRNGVLIRVRAHERSVPERTGNPYLDKAIEKVLARLDENVRNSIEIVRWDREI